MRSLIRGYTLEAGVRRLQRTIGKVVRKSAVEMIDENIDTVTVTPEKLEKFLGAPRFHYEKAGKKPEVGVVNGLADIRSSAAIRCKSETTTCRVRACSN